MKFDIEYYSHIGKRSENQDSFSFKTFEGGMVACIADGVGGKLGGGRASKIGTDYFAKSFINEVSDVNELSEIPMSIHNEIIKESQAVDSYGMATTFTGIVISNNLLRGVHTGDSRACILRGNGIKQLTHDHTEVARLIRERKITKKESVNYPRRNIIESALGVLGDDPKIEEFNFEIKKGDKIILTTDGVHEVVSKRNFRDISIVNKTSKQFIETLITYLKRKEPNDNNTILVITISD